MAKNPPACPAEKRSLGENLVNDRRNPAQLRLRAENGMSLNFIVLKFRLGSPSEPNVCSHCYSVPYMKISAKNQVMLSGKWRPFGFDLNVLTLELGWNNEVLKFLIDVVGMHVVVDHWNACSVLVIHDYNFLQWNSCYRLVLTVTILWNINRAGSSS